MTQSSENSQPAPVKLVTVADLAAAYGVHPRTILRAVKNGHLKPERVPGLVRALRFHPNVLPKARPAA